MSLVGSKTRIFEKRFAIFLRAARRPSANVRDAFGYGSTGSGEPVGFYEKGMSSKNTLPLPRGGMFFRHPAPIRGCTNPGRGAAGRTDFAGGLRSHKLMPSSRGLIAPLSSVMAIANH